MSPQQDKCLGRREGLEGAIDRLERVAALPVLPGLEERWLEEVAHNLERVEAKWSEGRGERPASQRLRPVARGIARREELQLTRLQRLRREAARTTLACENLRQRILGCAAGVRHVLDALHRLQRLAARS